MTDKQIIYTACKFQSVLDGLESSVFGASEKKVEAFNFLRKISTWLGEASAVFICARIGGNKWMAEEMLARVTTDEIKMVEEWDAILEKTITAIKNREDHPAERDFAFILNARYLAGAIIKFANEIHCESGEAEVA